MLLYLININIALQATLPCVGCKYIYKKVARCYYICIIKHSMIIVPTASGLDLPITIYYHMNSTYTFLQTDYVFMILFTSLFLF